MKTKTLLKVLMAGAVLSTSMISCKSLDMTRLSQAATLGTQALTISNDDVIAIVKQSVAKMDAQNTIAPATSPYTQRLNKLTQGLTTTGTVPLNFKVYVTNQINAFACADGSVRVYTGIMDLMTDDELLGIIGHEVGHVAMEHSKNAFKQQLTNMALLEALASTSGTVANLTDSQWGQLAETYASAKFSRKQENEADDFGYNFLKAAGKNPYAMVLAFEKMQKLENSSNANVNSYLQKMFSSHPETSERIARMQEKCKKDGFTRPTTTTTTSSTKTTTKKK